MLKNKTNLRKKGTTVVYFRCDPDNGSDKRARLFLKRKYIEKIKTRRYVTGENNIVIFAKF